MTIILLELYYYLFGPAAGTHSVARCTSNRLPEEETRDLSAIAAYSSHSTSPTEICTLLLSLFAFVLSIQALLRTYRPLSPSWYRILSLQHANYDALLPSPCHCHARQHNDTKQSSTKYLPRVSFWKTSTSSIYKSPTETNTSIVYLANEWMHVFFRDCQAVSLRQR